MLVLPFLTDLSIPQNRFSCLAPVGWSTKVDNLDINDDICFRLEKPADDEVTTFLGVVAVVIGWNIKLYHWVTIGRYSSVDGSRCRWERWVRSREHIWSHGGVGNVANGELRCRWCWKRIWSKSRSSRIMESLWRTDVAVVGSIAGSLVVVIVGSGVIASCLKGRGETGGSGGTRVSTGAIASRACSSSREVASGTGVRGRRSWVGHGG